MKTGRERRESSDEGKPVDSASIAGILQATYPELAGIKDASWQAAIRNAVQHRFKARAVLLSGSTPINQFLLLIAGSARVYYPDPTGRQITLYCVNPGDFCILSLGRLLRSGDLDVVAQARTDIHALGISERDFHSVLATSERFRHYVLTSLNQRLIELMRVVQGTAFQKIEVRLACLLGRLFERAQGGVFSITHQELAQELGASREVVSRALKDFEAHGCVTLRRGRIEVTDPIMLTKLGRNSPR